MRKKENRVDQYRKFFLLLFVRVLKTSLATQKQASHLPNRIVFPGIRKRPSNSMVQTSFSETVLLEPRQATFESRYDIEEKRKIRFKEALDIRLKFDATNFSERTTVYSDSTRRRFVSSIIIQRKVVPSNFMCSIYMRPENQYMSSLQVDYKRPSSFCAGIFFLPKTISLSNVYNFQNRKKKSPKFDNTSSNHQYLTLK